MQPERPGVARSQRPLGPGGRSRYKDYTFAGSPMWGWGRGRDWKLPGRANLFFPLSAVKTLQAYMVKGEKK